MNMNTPHIVSICSNEIGLRFMVDAIDGTRLFDGLVDHYVANAVEKIAEDVPGTVCYPTVSYARWGTVVVYHFWKLPDDSEPIMKLIELIDRLNQPKEELHECQVEPA